MLMLPMPKLSFKESQKYWKIKLDMVSAPKKKHGIEVEIIRNGSHIRKGSKGIARPFNPADIYDLIQKYNREIEWELSLQGYGQNLPSLNESFDFYPYYYKDGKKQISLYHTHITINDFKQINIMKATTKNKNTAIDEIHSLVKEKQIAKKFEGFNKNLELFTEYSTNLVIDSQENLTVAVNNSGVVNDTLKNVEDVRKTYGEPYRLTVSAINQYVKEKFTEPLEKIKLAINTAITNYKTVQAAAARAEAEKAAEKARKIAEEKTEEFERISRYRNQLFGRMYGGRWTVSNGEERSSDGCLNTEHCKTLRKLITTGMPDINTFIHCKEEYISMKDDVLSKLAEVESLIIDSKSSNENKSSTAKIELSKLRLKANNEAIQADEAIAEQIAKEENKVVKQAQKIVSTAGSGVRKTLVIELDDIEQVPSDWILINEKAIREWAHENKDTINKVMKEGDGRYKGIKFSLREMYASR